MSAAPTRSAPAPEAPAAQRPLLLVEDDAPLRQMLSWDLADLGYDIAAAAGCAEARRLAARQSFRFALIDVHLPDGDGRQLGAALAECGGLEQVVLMTGRHGVAAVPTRHGISALLTKPVDIGKIHRLFTAVLGSARPAAAG
ncbi:hypothetical protein CKO31_06370 [Thiohalocapsa halophila]|uniref:Response regulatory domain-containing protein n=1 Tax=Thiohalocapsa halophila TaxID=69359 RepID=A0ABS1CEP8_9GAMM|nr:response regulator [Thiohalocapsa halophila]MBK1630377.1 hypothetical protein [Thiohalocapsa halophila]